MVFRGGPVLTLDGKGRITVPARWREMIMALSQGQLVIAKNPAGCLSVYPLPRWQAFERTLLDLPTGKEAWRRFFIGSATEVEIDSASRVLVPPELRVWAGLEEKVKFMGVGQTLELWDTARQEVDENAKIAEGLPEQLANQVTR
jgi:MraZ protein